MLTVNVQPDAVTATKFLAQEEQERKEFHQNERSLILQEHKMGKLKMWAPENYDKARSLKPWEKIALDTMQGFLALRAQRREQKCWMHSLGCTRDAHVWVHEVGFDLKEMKADLNFAQVNSADIDGPSPGFCMFHLAEAPAMLAERVYFSHPAVKWGYLPSRWFIKYTDGTSIRGPIHQINPTMAQPDIVEEHLRGE